MAFTYTWYVDHNNNKAMTERYVTQDLFLPLLLC